MTEFMAQRNARKDEIRKKKMAKAVITGKKIAEQGLKRVPTEKRLQDLLLADAGKVIPDHKSLDVNGKL